MQDGIRQCSALQYSQTRRKPESRSDERPTNTPCVSSTAATAQVLNRPQLDGGWKGQVKGTGGVK